MEDNNNSVQIIDRTFTVLECISEGKDWTLNELHQRLGINKASLMRICNALNSNGYIKKDTESGKYSLSLKAFEVGVNAVRNLNYMELVRDILDQLAEETGAIAQFSIDENNELLCLECTDKSMAAFSVYSKIGSRTQLYASSAGKAILSAYSNEVIAQKWNSVPIKKFTENTITSFDRLLQEISVIRSKNYAVDMAESEIGLYCVGTVLLNYSKKPLGAISLSVPQLDPDEEARLSGILLKYTQRLSYMLGYSQR